MSSEDEGPWPFLCIGLIPIVRMDVGNRSSGNDVRSIGPVVGEFLVCHVIPELLHGVPDEIPAATMFLSAGNPVAVFQLCLQEMLCDDTGEQGGDIGIMRNRFPGVIILLIVIWGIQGNGCQCSGYQEQYHKHKRNSLVHGSLPGI